MPRRMSSQAQARFGLSARLRARRAEIEEAVLTRINAVSDPTETANPEYVEGLRAAVRAAVEYGFAAIEQDERRSPPLPTALLSQARMAAQTGVALDVVLRRYFAGHALLGDFLIDEAERSGTKGAGLKPLLRSQAALFDRLLVAVSDEYAREARELLDSSEGRRIERVERLLAGELVDTSPLAYEFDGSHLGLIATGLGAQDVVGALAEQLDCRFLLIRCGEETVWGWLRWRHMVDDALMRRILRTHRLRGVSVAFGEPGDGLPGWRLTHRQARAALPIALRRGGAFVRYADVALLASLLRDDLLTASLQRLYLAPLEKDRDGGEAARRTLRAYFAAGHNVSSAAAALDLSRQTVSSRIRTIEEALGRPLHACAAELEAALRMEDLGHIPDSES